MARYDGPIVDAHQHFWEPERNPHPWLQPGVQIPFRYGNYDAIKRRYLPDDYRWDAGRYRIVQTVYVETEWDPADPIGDTRYASSLPERYGLPTAIWRRPGSTGTTSRKCSPDRQRFRSSAASGTSRAVPEPRGSRPVPEPDVRPGLAPRLRAARDL